MKTKKTILKIFFIFVLVMIIPIVLCSCDNSQGLETVDYATFYYQNDGKSEPTVQKIKTDDFREDATLYDVLKLADYKYDFGPIFEEKKEEGTTKVFLGALINKGLEPNILQKILIYSDLVVAKTNNEEKKINVGGVDVYKTDSVLNNIQIEAGKSYVFKVSAEYKKPAFEKNLGDSSQYQSAITEPVIVGDNLLLIRDNYLVKLDKDCNELAKVKLSGITYYGGIYAPIIAGKNIVCGLMSGYVESFNIETLEKNWTYKHTRQISSEKCTYDIASPMIYDAETDLIYVGTNAKLIENGKTASAEMVALDAKTGEIKSYTSSKEGYYFTSPIIIKDALISSFVDDNGKNYIVAYDKTNLAIKKDKIAIKGAVRSSFEYLESENSLFYISKDGEKSYINRIWFDEETNKFGVNIISEETVCSISHGKPAIYKNRMYVTSANGKSFDATEGYLQVFDIKSMKEIYRVNTGALNSSTVYIKPVIHNKQEEIFVFFTLNDKEAGLQYIVDKENAISGVMYTTHVPKNNNNSMSKIVVDKDGSMYYKNDSNIITKIDKGYFSK